MDPDDILNDLLLDVKVPQSHSNYKQIRINKSRKKPKLETLLEPDPPPQPISIVDIKSEDSQFDNDDSNWSLEQPFVQPNETYEKVPIASTDHANCSRMYWYDCVEDQNKHPGTVYFFGRTFIEAVNRFVSCCAIVKNVHKTCYLLITPDSTYEQAVGELTNITAKKYRLKNFSCSKVTKKYAFSSNSSVPYEADYVRVDYPATLALPSDMRGETFSQVFNINQSPMEKMILELKLRGPCWLRLIDPVESSPQITWSRIELVLNNPSQLQVDNSTENLPPTPYFCTFSLCLRTYPNAITNQNEIVAIAGMVNTCFHLDECLKRNNKASGHFCLMTKPAPNHKELRLPHDFERHIKKNPMKTVFELHNSERDLLQAFMDRFNNLDPDIVVGHDLMNFDFETLVMRMKVVKLGIWSQLGRFRRFELPASKAAFKYSFSGRVLCDIKTSAEELIHARAYDLTELTSQVLNQTRKEYTHQEIVESFKSSTSLVNLLTNTWEDNDNIFSILVELNVIPLALKITNITGNILSRTLAAGRSERNEYLLMHAFHEENFICPEKVLPKSKFNRMTGDNESNPIRKKAAYSGGLVLEPKTGFYDSCVLLMDFNSLYPSIIQEFNICFSTVKVPEEASTEAAAQGDVIADVPPESSPTGVLPTQLKRLVDRRREVKRLLADSKLPAQKLMLDIEQKALKLTANSMYGCLGFEHSRFYAKHLASLVTFKGREILMSTKAMVEQLGYEVIYGDTDSLMINTKVTEYDEVILKGTSIKTSINRTFKLLEIDIDGVYKPLLLLKKKNYAGAAIKKAAPGQITRSIETKGLDTVRRDRAVIAKEAGERVLSMILSSEKDVDQIVEDIHAYLKQLADQVRAKSIEKEKFLISKQLNKNPEEYRDLKGLGHVILALRQNQDPTRAKKLRSGDTIAYVICDDGSKESANQRAYTLEELGAKENLKIDDDYYLCQQIFPVMVRICGYLPGTNPYVLAEMMGIEKNSDLKIKPDNNDGVQTKRDQLISKGESRFNSCKPIAIKCPNCQCLEEIKTKTRKNKDKKLEYSLTTCQQCNVRYSMRPKLVVVQVINALRQLSLQLFGSKFVCENSECSNETRNMFCQINAKSAKVQLLCEYCDGQSSLVPEMDDRKLDLQLTFWKHLFNIERDQQSLPEAEASQLSQTTPDDVLEMYRECHREIDYALRCSYLNNIDTYSAFSMVCSGR